MPRTLLSGLRVVSTALNLPGPAACARLRAMGATVVKVEPPDGDPLERYCAAWYRELHEETEIRRLDLKRDADRALMNGLLQQSDVLVTAQRPSALARLGLDDASLAASFPRLCHVAITGHGAPAEEIAGHDLTYLAAEGLVSPPALPATLFADMAGAERAVGAALALVHARDRTGTGGTLGVALADVAHDLAQPLHHGLTARGALLGGKLAGYNLYETGAGWIALAALEPRFLQRLAQALGISEPTRESLAQRFSTRTASEWERWAREIDLPLVAIPLPSQEKKIP